VRSTSILKVSSESHWMLWAIGSTKAPASVTVFQPPSPVRMKAMLAGTFT